MHCLYVVILLVASISLADQCTKKVAAYNPQLPISQFSECQNKQQQKCVELVLSSARDTIERAMESGNCWFDKQTSKFFCDRLNESNCFDRDVEANQAQVCTRLGNTTVSLARSTVFYPNISSASYDDAVAIKQDVLLTCLAEEIFKKSFASNSDTYFHYAATRNNVIRLYPGYNLQATDPNYEVGDRSWFLSGTTGPKNVLLVIDLFVASNTNYTEYVRAMTTYVDALFAKLSTADYFNVLIMKGDIVDHPMSTLDTCFKRYLMRATFEAKCRVAQYIKQAAASQSISDTTWQKAFGYAFEFFNQSRIEGYYSSCQDRNMLVVITDNYMGRDTTLPQYIRENNNQNLSIIIVKTNEIHDVAASAIACENRGVTYQNNSWNAKTFTDLLNAYYTLNTAYPKNYFIYSTPYADALQNQTFVQTIMAPVTLQGFLVMLICIDFPVQVKGNYSIARNENTCAAVYAQDKSLAQQLNSLQQICNLKSFPEGTCPAFYNYAAETLEFLRGASKCIPSYYVHVGIRVASAFVFGTIALSIYFVGFGIVICDAVLCPLCRERLLSSK